LPNRCITFKEQRMSPHHPARLSILSACLGLALFAAAGSAAAQGASAPATGGAMKAGAAATVPAADMTLAMMAAVGGMAEVELGKMAQQKASNDQVKQFGSRMVDDHSKANDELKQIASSKGITLPTDLDAKHKSKMAKMEKLSGAQFDRAYMDDMLADHKEDVAEFKKESTSGKDSDLKAFASKTLPTLQDHLKMAQSTDAAVKSAKSTASR
jgi:putative membrane protein